MSTEEDARQAFEEGERLRKVDEYATALAAFDRAAALKPDFAEAWLHRGLCLIKLKRHQRAFASIEKSLKYNPASAWTWFFRGGVLFEMGKYHQAVESYETAIALRGGDFPPVWNAKNALLTFLEVWLKEKLPQKLHLTAYELVTWVEERLHMFVRQRLQQAFGEKEAEWWHQGVPQPIRKKCAERVEEDPERRPLYNYTDLIDLKDLMDKNWRHFEADFQKVPGEFKTKKEFLGNLERLNEIRKSVMHPVRGGLTEADLAFAHQIREVIEAFCGPG